MFWLATRELLSRKAITALAAIGLVTATLGYIVLATTSETAAAQLHGDIAHAWATPFDLLVRPEASLTPLERSDGLIRPNYLSSISGGVTTKQLDVVRSVPGVDVAAPIAMVGVDVAPGDEPLFDLSNYDRYPHSPGVNVFRISRTDAADAGLSRYPLPTVYAVVFGSPNPMWVHLGNVTFEGKEFMCSYPVFCFTGAPEPNPVGPGPGSDHPVVMTPSSTLMVIAGVDPESEARLDGLNRCVVSGRYLKSGDIAGIQPGSLNREFLSVPALISTHSFLDLTEGVQVERALDPAPLFAGADPAGLASWQPIDTLQFSAEQQYQKLISTYSEKTVGVSPGITTISDVSYEQVGPNHLRALTQTSNPRALPLLSDRGETDSMDTWFRTATLHRALGQSGQGKVWDIVGSYDPTCLPSFNQLAGGAGLDAYSNPKVTMSNGKILGPSLTLTGYVNSPPLLLTTLDGARALTDPLSFSGQPGAAFISVIRIKVAGTENPGPISEARLARVAAEIHDRTGLHVDIVKGSSTEAVQVDLPAGDFGRPALTVTELWSTKGVAISFSRAVTAQNLALFTLVLIGACGLVGQTTYMTVRHRRRELGVLRAVGWPPWRIAALVETETVLLGALAGIVALGLGAVIAFAFHLSVAWWQWSLAIPLAMVVAGVSAALPAASAALAGTTASAMSVNANVRKSHVTKSLIALAGRDLFSAWRVEAMLGIAAIALGSTLIAGVVLVEGAFRGQVDTTVLGTYLAARVQPFHIALAALTLAIAILAAAEVLTLTYLERQTNLATLRASGWPRHHIIRLVSSHAAILGFLSALGSVAVITTAGALLRAELSSILLASASAVLVAGVATTAAVALPIWLSYRLSPSEHLHAE